MRINGKIYREVEGAILPGNFTIAVRMLERPYIEISERDFRRLMDNSANDVIEDRSGRQYTWGNADGGRFWLMPIRKGCYFKTK